MLSCSACGGFRRPVMVDGHASWCPYVSDSFWHVFQYDANGTGYRVWATPVQQPVDPADIRRTPIG